ncbi:MAG TPA: head GIN domain-containing protein [Candidatus Kapabacteria bacterium]|jgi:hypothetical protein
MKKILPILSIFALTCVFSSCSKLAAFMPNTYSGNGTVTNETRNTEPFQAVELEGAYDVTVTQGLTTEVKIETDQNLLAHITTTVKDGKLIVKSEGNLQPTKNILVSITSPNYHSIESDGSSDIHGATPIVSDDLKLDLEGSGSYDLGVNVKKLQSEIEGSGTITLHGISGDHKMSIDGSGDIDADSLTAETAKIEIEGSGDASLNVNTRLDASINGSGGVKYRGPVTDVHTDISGSGSVGRTQ